MTQLFDPYHKWLGIPPEDQPPTYYRLLGIRTFENDPDVIQNAADQRMALLHTLQMGTHAALSQRLLNELATAKVCLLCPERKAEYDRWLWDVLQRSPAADSAAQVVPAEPQTMTGWPAIRTKARKPTARVKRSATNHWQAVCVLAGVLSVALGFTMAVAILAREQSQGRSEAHANGVLEGEYEIGRGSHSEAADIRSEPRMLTREAADKRQVLSQAPGLLNQGSAAESREAPTPQGIDATPQYLDEVDWHAGVFGVNQGGWEPPVAASHSYPSAHTTPAVLRASAQGQRSLELRPSTAAAERPSDPPPTSIAPAFVAAGLDGSLIDLKSEAGTARYVLLDFWGHWCPYCRMEYPHLRRLHERYKDRGLRIIGINCDSDRAEALQVAMNEGLCYPHVFDSRGSAGRVRSLYRVRGIPQTYLLDCDLKIIAQGLRGTALEDRIAELLGPGTSR